MCASVRERIVQRSYNQHEEQKYSMSGALVNAIGKTGTDALANGIIGSAVDYFIIGTRGSDQIFGIQVPSWGIAFIEAALESISADILGYYAIPAVERLMPNASSNMQRITKFAVPPVIAGLTHVAIERFYFGNRESMIRLFGISAIQNLAVDAAIKNFFFPNA